MISRAMCRPRPTPRVCVLRRWKGSKIRSRSSAGMPGPRSLTATRIRVGSSASSRSIGLSAGAYLIALSMMLVRTSSIRTGSTLTGSRDEAGPWTAISRPVVSASSSARFRARVMTSVGARSRSIRPDRIRLTSMSRSTRERSLSAPFRTMARDKDCDGLSDHLVRGISIDPLGSRVPADDRSVEGFPDDRVIRGVDDRREILRGQGCALSVVTYIGPHTRSVAGRRVGFLRTEGEEAMRDTISRRDFLRTAGAGGLILLNPFRPLFSQTRNGNVLLRWNDAFLQGVRESRLGPPMVSRALAVAHTCIFDAWAAYDRLAVGTRLGGTLRRPARERSSMNKEMAISFAAYRAGADLFPASVATVFDPLMTSLSLDPADRSLDAKTPTGIGNLASAAVLALRHQDGANQIGEHAGSIPGCAYSDYTGFASVHAPMDIRFAFHA